MQTEGTSYTFASALLVGRKSVLLTGQAGLGKPRPLQHVCQGAHSDLPGGRLPAMGATLRISTGAKASALSPMDGWMDAAG